MIDGLDLDGSLIIKGNVNQLVMHEKNYVFFEECPLNDDNRIRGYSIKNLEQMITH